MTSGATGTRTVRTTGGSWRDIAGAGSSALARKSTESLIRSAVSLILLATSLYWETAPLLTLSATA